MIKRFYFFGFISIIVSCLSAQIIHVPADQASIQAGINASNDGDTVLVSHGTYYENINFNGKAIILCSQYIFENDTNHIRNTIIDGSQPTNSDMGTVISLTSGEDTTSVVCGFTITGGTGTYFPGYGVRAAGAIYCDFSGAKVINNYIEYNGIDSPGIGYGGAIDQYGDNWFVLRDNILRFNYNIGQEGSQGGAGEFTGNVIIEGNKFIGNTCSSDIGQSGGGALFLSTHGASWSSELLISNNVFYGNSVSCDSEYAIGGALWVTQYSGIIEGNIIDSNTILNSNSGFGAGIAVVGTDNISLIANMIVNNYEVFGSCFGGGLYIEYGQAWLSNNVFRDNYADYGGGIMILDTGQINPSVISNNTLFNNHAYVEGGGFHIQDASAVTFNNIIWGNEAPVDPEIYDAATDLYVEYSDIGGTGWPGEGNINVNPDFQDEMSHINSESDCVDAGALSIEIGGILYSSTEFDYEGDPRPNLMCTIPLADIGADESTDCTHYIWVNPPHANNTDIEVYPNPFTTTVSFKYSTDNNKDIQLSISNSKGQLIYTTTNVKSERDIIIWDGSSLPAGVYLYRLTNGSLSESGKLIKLP